MEDFGELQNLIDRYNQQKQKGLIWLVCYLYSLDTMKNEGYSTPSTQTLAISGLKERSTATIKRYLATLISLGLIKRDYSGRKHTLFSTELGQRLFNSRKQNPVLVKARIKIEPLNKSLNPKYNIINNIHLDYIGSAQKPDVKRSNLRMLRNMLKKCTKSIEETERLESEILFSITKGALQRIRNVGNYHLIPNAINIAVWLVKKCRWETPAGYTENEETLMIHNKKDAKKAKSNCSICKKEHEYTKHVVTKKGPMWLCPECYPGNLDLEVDSIKPFVLKLVKDEFLLWCDEKFDYSRFKHAKSSRIRFCEPDPEDEVDDKITMGVGEFGAHLKVEGLLENYFKFGRQKA